MSSSTGSIGAGADDTRQSVMDAASDAARGAIDTVRDTVEVSGKLSTHNQLQRVTPIERLSKRNRHLSTLLVPTTIMHEGRFVADPFLHES